MNCLLERQHISSQERTDETRSQCWILVVDKYAVQLNGKGVFSVETGRCEGVPSDVTFRVSKFRKRGITC